MAKNRLVEDLREMENQKAKLTLERKNLMSACETLASKFNLESQQNLNLQGTIIIIKIGLDSFCKISRKQSKMFRCIEKSSVSLKLKWL